MKFGTEYHQTVLDLVSQVRDVVLMNVYLDRELRGVGILGQGVYETGEGNGELVYEQPGYEADRSCHSKEGSK
jgi:hypothetical protein